MSKQNHMKTRSIVKCNSSIGLYEASSTGQFSRVQKIVNQGRENINCRGYMDRTPVMAAARYKEIQVFDFLVSHGCDMFAVDLNSEDVLHIACKGGSTDIVRRIVINERLNIESRQINGMTPVMLAARYGNKEVFDLLLTQGCDMDVINHDTSNILHAACVGGNVDIAKYILQLNITGVHIESQGLIGWTPVMIAVTHGRKEMFEFLVKQDCNLLIVDEEKDNILHAACMGGNIDIVEYIVKQRIPGLDIESRGLAGRTPVMRAARYSHFRVFSFLVEVGSNLSVVDEKENTVLHMACKGGDVDIVTYLITHRVVKMNVKNIYGDTPVQLAKSKGHNSIVALIKGKNAIYK